MAYRKPLLFLYFIHIAYCDWVVDWMNPIQEQLRQKAASRRMMDVDVVKMVHIKPDVAESLSHSYQPRAKEQHNMNIKLGLKDKLEDTLRNAEDLLLKLQVQIANLEKKEKQMKDAIVNGRSGVSTVTVSTATNQPPRSYIVRDGQWSICHGMVQYPVNTAPPKSNMFNDIFATPRCIGQEIPTKQDPCVFNSVIKYETVPDTRGVDYTEGNFFCLRPSFNKSLEQYLSVPKTIIDNTCQNGIVRSLQDNIQQCGQRVLSEYTYYPIKSNAASLYPMEYCTEKDGSCKLIVAWHLSNKTVENFEFLKKEDNFKNYFIKPSFVEHIL